MLFSEKLKMLRKNSGYTQEELAEKLNVSRQAITKWESDEGLPDIENLKQISILFDITLDELIKEDKEIDSSVKYKYEEELDIDHTKHFDINICKIYELNLCSNEEEKVKLELISKEESNIKDIVNVKFDDLYNRLDIDIKSKKSISDLTINLYIPEKYIEEIELNSKLKKLNISNININEFEYDGELKYLNVINSKSNIVLNATKCDVEAKYDVFEGTLEINTVNSTSRLEIPKDTKYKTILKGIKNEFIDSNNNEESNNIIELNGINSKLIIIEK